MRAYVLSSFPSLFANFAENFGIVMDNELLNTIDNSIRLEEAYDLLTNHPEMKISEVASKVGFSVTNFRAQYKRCYGITPAEYRASLITDQEDI